MKPDWNLLVPTLSINPDAATRDDVARLAAELMEARHVLSLIAEGTCDEWPYPLRAAPREELMKIAQKALEEKP